jgi:hypothetical protein
MSDIARIPSEQIAEHLRALRVPDELVKVHLERLARWRQAHPIRIKRYRPDDVWAEAEAEAHALYQRRKLTRQRKAAAKAARRGTRKRKVRNGNGT